MFLFLAVGGPQEGHALHQSTCARASLDSGTCMNKIKSHGLFYGSMYVYIHIYIPCLYFSSLESGGNTFWC